MSIDYIYYRELLLLNVPNNIDGLLITPFTSLRTPSISMNDYICRVLKYIRCSDTSLILSLIYIKRLSDKYGSEFYNRYSFHRIYITSILVAAKFIDDKFYNNKYYAIVGGITSKEITELEICILKCLNFNLNVTLDEYDKMYYIVKNNNFDGVINGFLIEPD